MTETTVTPDQPTPDQPTTPDTGNQPETPGTGTETEVGTNEEPDVEPDQMEH